MLSSQQSMRQLPLGPPSCQRRHVILWVVWGHMQSHCQTCVWTVWIDKIWPWWYELASVGAPSGPVKRKSPDYIMILSFFSFYILIIRLLIWLIAHSSFMHHKSRIYLSTMHLCICALCVLLPGVKLSLWFFLCFSPCPFYLIIWLIDWHILLKTTSVTLAAPRPPRAAKLHSSDSADIYTMGQRETRSIKIVGCCWFVFSSHQDESDNVSFN